MQTSGSISMPDLLAALPEQVQPTVEAARRLVRAVAPDADELFYQSRPPRSATTMWKLLRYDLDGAPVLGIGTFPRHSTIYFYRGRELDGGRGPLQGGGRETRFVTVRTPQEVDDQALCVLVRRAFDLAATSPA
jgi:hypothetical protein